LQACFKCCALILLARVLFFSFFFVFFVLIYIISSFFFVFFSHQVTSNTQCFRKNATLSICVITRPREFETNTYTQHTTSQFYMFLLYLVKTNNVLYGMKYSIKITRHRISLPQACGHATE